MILVRGGMIRIFDIGGTGRPEGRTPTRGCRGEGWSPAFMPLRRARRSMLVVAPDALKGALQRAGVVGKVGVRHLCR